VFLAQIQEFIQSLGLKIISQVEKEEEQKVKRISAFDIPNYKTCPEEFILKIKELRYSESTEKTYKSALEDYLNYHHSIDIDRLNEGHIQAFLRYLVMERKVSTSYQNQAINAIKFYYERVLGGQRKTYFIDRPKKEKSLPVVMSEEEIIRVLRAVENVKHKAILMVIYSAGLRISECINLKIKDIDSSRMQIRVEQAKGKKDRYTILSEKTLYFLRTYFLEYKPKVYLFEGQTGGIYSKRSIQNIFKAAASKAGIQKQVTVHTLRHSFATHLLENGVNLRYIQSLLGHSSSKTTEIYTHVTTKGMDQLKSPMDMLDI
jgi:integrase/recombinase XerD